MNNQKPWPRSKDASGRLQVHSVFHTIQGEGPFSGVPATFIRLAGCNLQCPLCDTQYTEGMMSYRPDDLAELVKHDLVVITGGEPFRQDLHDLVETLLWQHKVQIETNGTIFTGSLPEDVDLTVVCSPKTGKIHPKLRPHITHYKYVLEAGYVADDGLPTRVLGLDTGENVARPPEDFDPLKIYVHGADMAQTDWHPAYHTKQNIQAAVDSAMAHGYRFGLQVHKLINMP